MNKQIPTKDLHLCKICNATITSRYLYPNVLHGDYQYNYDENDCYYVLAYKFNSIFKGFEYLNVLDGECYFDKDSAITSIQTSNLPLVIEDSPIMTKKKRISRNEAIEYIKTYNNGYIDPNYTVNTIAKTYKLVKM